MKGGYRNICKIGRQTAGLTQERWAEAIDVSVEAVRQYEAGKIQPSDDVAVRLAEVAGLPILGYWHLLNKGRISDGLPDIEPAPLAEAVCGFAAAFHAFLMSRHTDALIQIARDGRVDDVEAEEFRQILEDVDELCAAAAALRYARGK